MTLAYRSIVITAASRVVPTPGEAAGSSASLTGLALFVAERTDDDRWSFDIRARVLATGQREETLLEWAADRLPDAATVIGWRLGDRLVPLLLDATRRAPPKIAHHFASQLARLVTDPVIDLACVLGGTDAPTFAEIVAMAGINAAASHDDAGSNIVSIEVLRNLRVDLAAEAVALWRYWARREGETGADAAVASWLAGRRRDLSGQRTGDAA